MDRAGKSAVIDRLREALTDVPSIVVADFQGLTVEKTEELRSTMRKAGVTYEVVKNTLAKKAIAGTTMESLGPLFKGNSAIAFHDEEPALAAKILLEFSKKNEALGIKGGWVDGNFLDETGVEALSKLPGKDELRGTLLNVMQGAPRTFVQTIIAAPQQFVYLLKAREDDLAA